MTTCYAPPSLSLNSFSSSYFLTFFTLLLSTPSILFSSWSPILPLLFFPFHPHSTSSLLFSLASFLFLPSPPFLSFPLSSCSPSSSNGSRYLLFFNHCTSTSFLPLQLPPPPHLPPSLFTSSSYLHCPPPPLLPLHSTLLLALPPDVRLLQPVPGAEWCPRPICGEVELGDGGRASHGPRLRARHHPGAADQQPRC